LKNTAQGHSQWKFAELAESLHSLCGSSYTTLMNSSCNNVDTREQWSIPQAQNFNRPAALIIHKPSLDSPQIHLFDKLALIKNYNIHVQKYRTH